MLFSSAPQGKPGLRGSLQESMGRHALTPLACLVKGAALQPGCKKDHLSEKALGHTRRHISALKFHAAVGGDPRCQIFYPLMNFHRSWDSPFERLSELVWVLTTRRKIYSSDPFTPTKIVKLGPKQLSEAQIRSVSQFYSSRCP